MLEIDRQKIIADAITLERAGQVLAKYQPSREADFLYQRQRHAAAEHCLHGLAQRLRKEVDDDIKREPGAADSEAAGAGAGSGAPPGRG